MAAPSSAKSPPLFTPFGLVLLAVFAGAIVAAGLSTQNIIKRIDLPPPGTFVVVSGRAEPLFIKLAQKSVKGLHRTLGVRGQIEAPDSPPHPLHIRDTSSREWEGRIKTSQFASADPADLESNIVLLLSAEIPDSPALYGRTVPASFHIDMVIPRLDPNNPRAGRADTVPIAWTVQLQIQPPGFLRVYEKVNRIALGVAGAVVLIALVRQTVRHLRRRRAS